ncbi:MAG: hypothetical protein FWE70_06210 [Oscillospiraceae bacterium]|nr:hypothetical protein [Oscillospiraceae bacterium]
MRLEELKAKLRKMKKAESAIRFGRPGPKPGEDLVWDSFFCTKSRYAVGVRFPMADLESMDGRALGEAFGEYFAAVYMRRYRDLGLSYMGLHERGAAQGAGGRRGPGRGGFAGLFAGVGSESEAKAIFRELAKSEHPDAGGDGAAFNSLMEAYGEAMGRLGKE